MRERFLTFFERHGHTRVPSSPLVPENDPTLLFTNAGMVQFKDVFLGHDERAYTRATSVQRCVRAGGKHNDLENVGYTARHHTFFEMLGNFSFGDYFKSDAIRYAWEFLTDELGLPPDKLWVTVYEEDDDAANTWLQDIGVDKSRFARIGASDNFWAMGDTGPCGPCSEIFYDHGPSVAGGDRYVEIWNLVFMQYNRNADGQLASLPKPSVDTGMGLERLATVLQGVHNNYDIDLFKTLVTAAQDITGAKDKQDKALRVLADHIRSTAFLITDNVVPANEGRGYVLRRIIRRAIRYGYQAGGQTPFFCKLVDPLAQEMGAAYPELVAARERVIETLKQEEERFAETLDQGMKIFDHETSALSGKIIPGEVAFKLYDTYGFPLDLTADVARERGLKVDVEGFDAQMAQQRERARAASQFAVSQDTNVEVDGCSTFTGYQGVTGRGHIMAIGHGGDTKQSLTAGEDGVVVLDVTPFYAESGGQVGDIGLLRSGDSVFEVLDTRKIGRDVIGHIGRVLEGRLAVNDEVAAEVDATTRAATMRNHSATHLLHAALSEVLGDHVQQKGSLVEGARLRFDFSHPQPVTPEELASIERLVNREILANNPVETRLMALDDAKASGAAALFGEKYEDEVRVVGMGEFSLELCGGTHVARTGDIGTFKIVGESGVAAGVRRIEALTGTGANEYLDAQLARLDSIAGKLRGNRDDAEAKVDQLLDQELFQQ